MQNTRSLISCTVLILALNQALSLVLVVNIFVMLHLEYFCLDENVILAVNTMEPEGFKKKKNSTLKGPV